MKIILLLNIEASAIYCEILSLAYERVHTRAFIEFKLNLGHTEIQNFISRNVENICKKYFTILYITKVKNICMYIEDSVVVGAATLHNFTTNVVPI